MPSELGKIYYLTIQESWVEAGVSQRRPRLHVDSPGHVKIKERSNHYQNHSIIDQEGNGKSQKYCGHNWGSGCAHLVGQRNADTWDYGDKLFAMKVRH